MEIGLKIGRPKSDRSLIYVMTITFTVTNGTLDRICDRMGGIVFALSDDDGFPNYRALIKMEDIPDYLRKKVLREERKWSGDPLRVPLRIRRLRRLRG